MATLYIPEFSAEGRDTSANLMPVAAAASMNAQQTVTIGASSAASSAFSATTSLVRLHTDAKCNVVFGPNPTATTVMLRMAADTTEYFSVPAGQSWKVAVIAGA